MSDEQRSNDELIRLGYRCTSRKYGILARIDRPDWVEFLKHELMREDEEGLPNLGDGGWEDFYRRVHSKDKIEISPARARKFPTSCWDPIGFVGN